MRKGQKVPIPWQRKVTVGKGSLMGAATERSYILECEEFEKVLHCYDEGRVVNLAIGRKEYKVKLITVIDNVIRNREDWIHKQYNRRLIGVDNTDNEVIVFYFDESDYGCNLIMVKPEEDKEIDLKKVEEWADFIVSMEYTDIEKFGVWPYKYAGCNRYKGKVNWHCVTVKPMDINIAILLTDKQIGTRLNKEQTDKFISLLGKDPCKADMYLIDILNIKINNVKHSNRVQEALTII